MKEKVQSFVFGMVKIGCLYVAALTFFNITSSFAYETVDYGYGTYNAYYPLAGFLNGPYSYFSAIMTMFVAGIFMATVITGLLNKKGSPAGVITMLSVSFVCFITGMVVFSIAAEDTISVSIGSYVLVVFTTILLVTAIIFSFLERNKKAYRQ